MTGSWAGISCVGHACIDVLIGVVAILGLVSTACRTGGGEGTPKAGGAATLIG